MTRNITMLSILIALLMSFGCAHPQPPKGAVPYLINGCDKSYAITDQDQHPNEIVLWEFKF
jgi:hypothetical protein